MKKYLNIKNILIIVLSLVILVFVYNDYFLYKIPIMKISRINTKVSGDKYSEKTYNQEITGIIKNSEYKNKSVTIHNITSTSGVYDEKIKMNSEIFLDTKDGEKFTFVGIKRDKYIAILLIIFIDLILFTCGTQGIKTLISLFVNVIISALSILVFHNNAERLSLLILYIFVSIIFIVTSLYITNGKSRKTFSAIISSITSLFVSFGFSYLVIHLCGKDVTIWTMNYIEYVRDYENYFYVCILLSGLGAIMDISITIASSLNELIRKNPKISKLSLIKSGKEISKDVVGTMSSVMLYTCFTPVIPLVFLAVKNNMPLIRAINYYGEIELVTVLCSAISIVLTIPISLYISTFILHSKKEVNND